LLGLPSVATSIMFDRVFSRIDAAMTLLALNVAILIGCQTSARLQWLICRRCFPSMR
jgi:predicted Co/Zn/Cd cation transporter (cation efflux family)